MFAAAAAKNFGAALPGLAQGFFGDSGKPYEEAWKGYKPFFEKAQKSQNPFFNAGTQAIPQFQEWLNSQKDPSAFINHLMGGYQESPWAHYQQQQGIRAAQNVGSATGLSGSTALQQQAQQNAQGISSQDMNQWLQNVLGINTQYGSGLQHQEQMGQHAGDFLSQLFSNAGEYKGGTNYGQEAGEQSDRNALWAGIAKLFGG
jgi:hypothetical protein